MKPLMLLAIIMNIIPTFFLEPKPQFNFHGINWASGIVLVVLLGYGVFMYFLKDNK